MWHSFLGSPHGWEVDFIAWFVSPPKQGLSHLLFSWNQWNKPSKWRKKSHFHLSQVAAKIPLTKQWNDLWDDPWWSSVVSTRPFQRDATPSTRLFRVTRNNCRLRRRGQKAFRQLHCHGISWLFSRIKLKAMYMCIVYMFYLYIYIRCMSTSYC